MHDSNKSELRRLGAAMAAAVMVTACGGGGGGNAPVSPISSSALTLTSGNYVSASGVALSTATSLLAPLDFITGAQVVDPGAGTRIALQAARQALTRTQRSPELVGGVTVSDSMACGGGGSVLFTTESASETVTSVGDNVTMNFNNCIEGGVTMQGAMSVRIDSLEGDVDTSDQYRVGATITLSGLTAVGGGTTLISQGVMTMDLRSFTAVRQDLTVTMPSVRVTGMLAGSAYERTTTNLVSVMRTAENGDTELEVSGRVSGSDLGGAHVDIETSVPLRQAWNELAPSAGVAVVRGAQPGLVQLSVQGGGMVDIALDADGNGGFEISTSRAWTELTGG